MQEAWAWSLGKGDPLEKEMVTHSSTLACKISWTEEPGGLVFKGVTKIRQDWATEHALKLTEYASEKRYTPKAEAEGKHGDVETQSLLGWMAHLSVLRAEENREDARKVGGG